jgi:hypothetical protein
MKRLAVILFIVAFIAVPLITGFMEGKAIARGDAPRFLGPISLLSTLVLMCVGFLLIAWHGKPDPLTNKLLTFMERRLASKSWGTWSPFQSQSMRAICRHMTAEERTKTFRLGSRFAIRIAPTMVPLFCAQFVPFVVESAFILPAAALVAACSGVWYGHIVVSWREGVKVFLCSTEWATTQGISPAGLLLERRRFWIYVPLLIPLCWAAFGAGLDIAIEWLSRDMPDDLRWRPLPMTWQVGEWGTVRLWGLFLIVAVSFEAGALTGFVLARRGLSRNGAQGGKP